MDEENGAPPLPGAEEAEAFLAAAEQVAAIFGSLSVERHRRRRGEAWEPAGPVPPRFLLEGWLQRTAPGKPEEGQLPEELRRRARALLDRQSGGRVAFYDALPLPGQAADLLQVDLLNPHYPLYYNDPAVPPSDDQNPTPVYFLALSPGVRLTFAFRAVPWNRAGDFPAAEEVTRRVRAWLLRGLTEQGAGAKTAAGYGYFQDPEQPGSSAADTAPPAEQATTTAPAKTVTIAQPSWQVRARGIDIGQARDHVPPLLASLEGEERRKAALYLIEKLDRRKLRAKQEQEWVKTLLAAAQE